MVTPKGAATRARIVDATVDLLIQNGSGGVSLDDVRSATATSKSQLFHYFPGGKAEILRVGTEAQVDRILKSQGEPLGELLSWQAWRDWIDVMVLAHKEQAARDACEVTALAGRAVEADPAARAVVGIAFNEWLVRLEAAIERMRAAGHLRREANPREIAVATLASLEGGAILDRATGSTAYLGIALEAAYDHLRSYAVH